MVEAETSETGASAEDIRRLCGDILDWKLAAIRALEPKLADLEIAVAWAAREDEVRERRPLTGAAAQIYDLLTADEDYGEER